MRLIPPNTKKKEFKGEKEITDYFFSFKVACYPDGELIPVKQCLLEMIENYETPTKALSFFISMFPDEHQGTAYTVFEKYLEEEKGLKIGIWISAHIYHLNEQKYL